MFKNGKMNRKSYSNKRLQTTKAMSVTNSDAEQKFDLLLNDKCSWSYKTLKATGKSGNTSTVEIRSTVTTLKITRNNSDDSEEEIASSPPRTTNGGDNKSNLNVNDKTDVNSVEEHYDFEITGGSDEHFGLLSPTTNVKHSPKDEMVDEYKGTNLNSKRPVRRARLNYAESENEKDSSSDEEITLQTRIFKEGRAFTTNLNDNHGNSDFSGDETDFKTKSRNKNDEVVVRQNVSLDDGEDSGDFENLEEEELNEIPPTQSYLNGKKQYKKISPFRDIYPVPNRKDTGSPCLEKSPYRPEIKTTSQNNDFLSSLSEQSIDEDEMLSHTNSCLSTKIYSEKNKRDDNYKTESELETAQKCLNVSSEIWPVCSDLESPDNAIEDGITHDFLNGTFNISKYKEQYRNNVTYTQIENDTYATESELASESETEHIAQENGGNNFKKQKNVIGCAKIKSIPEVGKSTEGNISRLNKVREGHTNTSRTITRNSSNQKKAMNTRKGKTTFLNGRKAQIKSKLEEIINDSKLVCNESLRSENVSVEHEDFVEENDSALNGQTALIFNPSNLNYNIKKENRKETKKRSVIKPRNKTFIRNINNGLPKGKQNNLNGKKVAKSLETSVQSYSNKDALNTSFLLSSDDSNVELNNTFSFLKGNAEISDTFALKNESQNVKLKKNYVDEYSKCSNEIDLEVNRVIRSPQQIDGLKIYKISDQVEDKTSSKQGRQSLVRKSGRKTDSSKQDKTQNTNKGNLEVAKRQIDDLSLKTKIIGGIKSSKLNTSAKKLKPKTWDDLEIDLLSDTINDQSETIPTYQGSSLNFFVDQFKENERAGKHAGKKKKHFQNTTTDLDLYQSSYISKEAVVESGTQLLTSRPNARSLLSKNINRITKSICPVSSPNIGIIEKTIANMTRSIVPYLTASNQRLQPTCMESPEQNDGSSKSPIFTEYNYSIQEFQTAVFRAAEETVSATQVKNGSAINEEAKALSFTKKRKPGQKTKSLCKMGIYAVKSENDIIGDKNSLESEDPWPTTQHFKGNGTRRKNTGNKFSTYKGISNRFCF